MSADLTEQELREAAAEAGISPEELRRAMAGQNGALVPTAAPDRRPTVYNAENQIALPPEKAAETVRQAIERISGAKGHRQGVGKADIVDEQHGVTYRIVANKDGAGGSIVRVDVDPSAGSGNFALMAFLIGGVSLLAVGIGLLFSISMFLYGGLGVAAVGGFALGNTRRKMLAGRSYGEGVVAQAILEAEDAVPLGDAALPGGATHALPGA